MSYLFTTNLGLVAVRDEAPSAQDWAATYWNWITIDQFLYNAIQHQHTGVTSLADPDAAPELTTADTGGTLPGGKAYFGVVSFVDSFGRQTGKSAAGTVTTAAAIAAPATPTYNFQATPTDLVATVDGLTGGDYWYKLTYVKGSGETLGSSPVYVSVPTDTTYAVTIHFDSLDTVANGADKIFVYRKSGSTGNYIKIVEISATSTDYYTDDNTAVPTCDKQPPVINTTNAYNTVSFDWSALDYSDAAYVKLYITATGTVDTPLFMQTSHLVTTIEVDLATPVTSYEWTGTTLSSGKPPVVSQSLLSPSKITLDTETQGNLPYANLPSGFSWLEPVDTFASLPTGNAGEAVVVEDEAAIYVWDATLATPTWSKLGGVLMYSKINNDDIPDAYSAESNYKTWIYMDDDNTMMFQGRISTSGEVFSIPLNIANIGGISDRGGYFGYSEDTPGWGDTPYYGYGAVTFFWNDKSFYYYDDTIATPGWVKGPGVVKTGSTIEDVTESATPTAVELKLNELLEVLRASGLIEA